MASGEVMSPAPIALTMGDPGGCGPQIAIEAWRSRKRWDADPFFIIGGLEVLKTADSKDTPLAVIEHPAQAREFFDAALPVLAIECPAILPGERTPAGAEATIRAIELAVELTHRGAAGAVVTNPINKALLYAEGFTHPGHTEYLAALAHRLYALDDIPHPVMFLTGGGLRVALATIHIPLRDVPDAITPELLSRTALITHEALRRDFALEKPRIALAGLNPHAGEDGALGEEELRIINPTAEDIRRRGINISNAQPGDTVFQAMRAGDYDAVIAMYHDQGLAPLKTLDMWGGVNATIGLPFIRTSPDHGTAYDAAGRGVARADSLIAALKLAGDMARARASVARR